MSSLKCLRSVAVPDPVCLPPRHRSLEARSPRDMKSLSEVGFLWWLSGCLLFAWCFVCPFVDLFICLFPCVVVVCFCCLFFFSLFAFGFCWFVFCFVFWRGSFLLFWFYKICFCCSWVCLLSFVCFGLGFCFLFFVFVFFVCLLFCCCCCCCCFGGGPCILGLGGVIGLFVLNVPATLQNVSQGRVCEDMAPHLEAAHHIR